MPRSTTPSPPRRAPRPNRPGGAALTGAVERPVASPDLAVRLVSDTGAVRQTLDSLDHRFAALGIVASVAEAAQIILAEVLNNVVEHAYRFEAGHPIDLAVWMRTDGLWCEVVDRGVAMPGDAPPPDRMPVIDPTGIAGLPEGGFGWAMVHRLTRGLSYSRTGGCNRLGFLIPA